jgi:hypothetical protein
VRWLACLAMGVLLGCSGDDSVADGGSDATVDATEEPDAAIADVAVDAPPERAIWVASATTLYKFEPVTHVVTRVADFDCSGEAMVDLAMDAKEELFGITTESVVRIDKTTGACTVLARGSQDLPYATAFVPAASLDSGVETWFGYKYDVYDSIDPDSGALTFAGTLASDAGTLQASGDLVSLAGGKTYLTSFGFDPNKGDGILEVDPNTGAVTRFDGFTQTNGLVGAAQWGGTLYLFSSAGRVYDATISDAGAALKILAVTYDLGDAGPPDAGGDASSDAGATDAGDAAAEASGPFVIHFRGAAVTTRAPTN